MDDLRGRLANRVQLTTDGHKAYLEAVEGAFGDDVDNAQLIKLYGNQPVGPQTCYARRNAPASARCASPASLRPNTSQPPTLNVRTSRSAWAIAGSRA